MDDRDDPADPRPAYGRASLAGELRSLGLATGDSVLVHSSLRAVGRVAGGAATVAAALRDVIAPDGTIVVLTATADNSGTSRTHLARTRNMSAAERRRYREAMPAYDPATTPSTGMGVLAEHIRTSSGARRSAHPQTSFAAAGPKAARFIDDHAPDCHYGENSPLARLYDADARVLLLGVGYDSCTAFHLAEYRYSKRPPTRRYSCVVERDGRPAWWSFEDVVLDDGDFPAIGRALDGTRWVTRGRVGNADSRLIRLRQAVDFAVGRLAEIRHP
jgi:aminoglycoside 3-N-acetyltransferase